MRLEGPFWCPGAARLATEARRRRFKRLSEHLWKNNWISCPAGPAQKRWQFYGGGGGFPPWVLATFGPGTVFSSRRNPLPANLADVSPVRIVTFSDYPWGKSLSVTFQALRGVLVWNPSILRTTRQACRRHGGGCTSSTGPKFKIL